MEARNFVENTGLEMRSFFVSSFFTFSHNFCLVLNGLSGLSCLDLVLLGDLEFKLRGKWATKKVKCGQSRAKRETTSCARRRTRTARTAQLFPAAIGAVRRTLRAKGQEKTRKDKKMNKNERKAKLQLKTPASLKLAQILNNYLRFQFHKKKIYGT